MVRPTLGRKGDGSRLKRVQPLVGACKLCTVEIYHLPPRADRSPQAFSASAMPASAATPDRLMASMIGRTFRAKRSASTACAWRPALPLPRVSEGFFGHVGHALWLAQAAAPRLSRGLAIFCNDTHRFDSAGVRGARGGARAGGEEQGGARQSGSARAVHVPRRIAGSIR
jgi:hypothetical protein